MAEEGTPEGPPDNATTGAGAAKSGRRRVGRLLVFALLGLLALSGAFFGGLFVGDDSSRVADLEETLAETDEDLGEAEDSLSESRDELGDLQAERDELAAELRAELDFEGEVPARGSGSAPEADFVLGQAGEVGPLNMKLVSLEQTGSSGGQATYVATISVKNNSDEPVDPFCADGATLIDDQGRTYTGDSLLRTGTPNCGDPLQPGLTQDGYEMEFKLPADAQPAVLELWGAFDINDEGDAGSWAVDG